MTDTTLEERLTGVFHRQADAVVVPPPDPRLVLTVRANGRVDRGNNLGRNRIRLLFIIALVVATAGGAAILAASPGTVANRPASDLDQTFDFDTQVGARLRATEFDVDTGSRTFSPTGVDVEVSGDPGHAATGDDQGYTTLELTWFEHNVDMRVYLYFASDSTQWWVDEIRTYDGTDPGDWIIMSGEYFRTPIGQPFVGDLNVGPLHIGEMVLEGFGPRLTSCDGSGRSGQLLLDLSGPRPVAGSIAREPGTASGYSTTIAVLDALTCESIEPEGVDFQAAVADPEVARLDTEGVTFDPSLAPGELYVGITFTGTGETVLTIEAVDQQTGAIAASIDIPVTVTDES